MLQNGETLTAPAEETRPAAQAIPKSGPGTASATKARFVGFLAVPAAVAVAYGIHLLLPNNELPPDSHLYSQFLAILLGVASLAAMVQIFWSGLQKWMTDMCPIFGAAVLGLGVWELITGVLHWLPLPYFPAPAGVLQSMVNDRALLFDSTWH